MKVYEIVYEIYGDPFRNSYGFYSNKGLAEDILKQLQKYDASQWYGYKIVEHEIHKEMPKWIFDTIEKYKYEWETMEKL